MISDVAMGAYHHYCSQLCNGLVACSDIAEVRLISIFGERALPGMAPEEQELLDPRVRTEILAPGARAKGWRYLHFMRNLVGYIRQLRRDPPDVVHIQTPTGTFLIDVLLLLLYRSWRLPIVRTVHEITAAERIGKPTGFERWIGYRQLRWAHALIAHDATTSTRLHTRDVAPRTPSTIIPHGNYLVFRRYRRPTSEATEPPGAMPVVLFLGVKRHKGLAVFLQALQQLQDAGYPIKAVIAGRINPGDADLIAALHALTMVEVCPGYVPNSKLWQLFERSDMVAMPYLQGTTSGALHLAYAFKRPVIASDLTCFQDLVRHGKTGLIVPRGDVVALKEALVTLANDRALRQRMGEEGFVLESSRQYQWDEIAAHTVQVYQQAMRIASRAVASQGQCACDGGEHVVHRE
jgi:glycosyltransferase involved in cell wall biosynthesis